MNRQEKRDYLIAVNSPTWMKFECEHCGKNAAVARDVFMQEDYGEAKGKEYLMLELFCLDCKETFTDWAEE